MTPCTWTPGCFQWTLSDEKTCFYHSKVRDGLIGAQVPLPAKPVKVDPASVVSDEQREIAAGLRALGADVRIVRRALAGPMVRRALAGRG